MCLKNRDLIKSNNMMHVRQYLIDMIQAVQEIRDQSFRQAFIIEYGIFRLSFGYGYYSLAQVLVYKGLESDRIFYSAEEAVDYVFKESGFDKIK